MPRPLIDLMIAGAEKTATSSLKGYLGQHPLAVTHEAREFTCFVNDKEYEAGYDRAYDAHFTSPADGQRIIAKSVGVMYQNSAQKRLLKHNPRVQLTVLLRNPVERAYSAFHFARQQGWEPLTDFDAALEAGTERFCDDWVRSRACDYLNRSRYAPHLRGCFDLFGKENVHVFLLEDLAQDPGAVCRALFNVLGIDPDVTIDWQARDNPARARGRRCWRNHCPRPGLLNAWRSGACPAPPAGDSSTPHANSTRRNRTPHPSLSKAGRD